MINLKSILLTFCTFLSVFGQIKIHKNISTKDGLINNQVRKILQDSKGYLWFATMGGASRWDGTNFLNFTELNGLTSAEVFDIAEGIDGTIYFANFGVKGITTYLDGKFDTLFTGPNNKLNFVSIIHINKDGSLLLAASDGIYLFKDDVLINLNELYNIPASSINKAIEADSGKVYFATHHGLLKYSKKKLSKVKGANDFGDKFLTAIGKSKNGDLYFGGNDNFYILSQNQISRFNPSSKINNLEINDIHFSENNIGYFATDLGLAVLENGKTELITLNNGLSQNRVYFIFEDKNNNIFLSNGISGVDIFIPNRLENYNSKFGLPNDNIYNVLSDNKGTIFLSTSSGLFIDNNTTKKTFGSSVNPTYIFSLALFKRENGEIIIGSRSGVDSYQNGKIKNIIKFKGTLDVHSKESNSVFSLAETNDGKILAGTFKGVYSIYNGEIKLITKSDGLISNYVQSILITKNNNIIYGYHGNGISIFKNNKYEHYSKINGLNDDGILSLCERLDGAILIGTQQGGLNILQSDSIYTITTDDGITSNEIRGIKEDSFGNIYLSTPSGLNIVKFNYDKFTIRTLTEEDGLAANDCQLNSLFADDQNNIWIGTTSGLSKYNPNYDKIITSPPPTYINGIEIFNKSQDLIKFKLNPELNYDQNYLKFSFIGINLSAPHKTIYKYKLSGIDKDWVTSKGNNVQYTSLDNGKYTFEVKARNEWGYWSEPTSLAFVINPAWWETWWFYSLTILAIGSLIAFVSSYRYRHLLAIEKMRSKISADLHDSIGSGLSEISILTELLGFKITQEKSELKSGLKNVSTISRTLIESMSDIVWLINPKKDSLKDLFKRLQLSYHEILKHSDVDLLFENLDNLENIKLPMNFRQHLYLIFKEAINNALKYSNADLLNLKIETIGNLLNVTFSDNGKGFDLNHDKMGNGLLNMQNRAKEIGGNIEYFSEVNKGTTIKFSGKFNKRRSNFI